MEADNDSEQKPNENGEKIIQFPPAILQYKNDSYFRYSIDRRRCRCEQVWCSRRSRWFHHIVFCCLVSHLHNFPPFWMTPIRLCSAFFGLIIGAKGSTKSRIENETDTKITIPRHGGGNIVIRGKNRESVCEARKQIESIIQSKSRENLSPTHFTNFRVTDEGIKSNFERFVVCSQFSTLVDSFDSALSIFSKKLWTESKGSMDWPRRWLCVRINCI